MTRFSDPFHWSLVLAGGNALHAASSCCSVLWSAASVLVWTSTMCYTTTQRKCERFPSTHWHGDATTSGNSGCCLRVLCFHPTDQENHCLLHLMCLKKRICDICTITCELKLNELHLNILLSPGGSHCVTLFMKPLYVFFFLPLSYITCFSFSPSPYKNHHDPACTFWWLS